MVSSGQMERWNARSLTRSRDYIQSEQIMGEGPCGAVHYHCISENNGLNITPISSLWISQFLQVIQTVVREISRSILRILKEGRSGFAEILNSSWPNLEQALADLDLDPTLLFASLGNKQEPFITITVNGVSEGLQPSKTNKLSYIGSLLKWRESV